MRLARLRCFSSKRLLMGQRHLRGRPGARLGPDRHPVFPSLCTTGSHSGPTYRRPPAPPIHTLPQLRAHLKMARMLTKGAFVIIQCAHTLGFTLYLHARPEGTASASPPATAGEAAA